MIYLSPKKVGSLKLLSFTSVTFFFSPVFHVCGPFLISCWTCQVLWSPNGVYQTPSAAVSCALSHHTPTAASVVPPGWPGRLSSHLSRLETIKLENLPISPFEPWQFSWLERPWLPRITELQVVLAMARNLSIGNESKIDPKGWKSA